MYVDMKKTLGIIGGMGPAATAALFQKIIDYTDAKCDKEHIHIIIDNYPQIPDRTKAINDKSNIPVKYICKAGNRLIEAGADIILIPCNTSHYFYDEVQDKLGIPIINMIEETARYCKENGYKKVGVLATTGTIKTKLFDRYFRKLSIETIYPSDNGQHELMNVIYNQVKAGKTIDTKLLSQYLREMVSCGIDVFVLGCTELPLAIKDGDYGYKFIDTLDVLAKAGIRSAGYVLK